MNNIIDMETIEELLRFLEAEQEAMKTEAGEQVGKPLVFIGQINEKNENEVMKISVVVTVADEEMLVRYIEPVGVVQIPQEDLKLFDEMKKEFDGLIGKVEGRKQAIITMFEQKEYPVFQGVLS